MDQKNRDVCFKLPRLRLAEAAAEVNAFIDAYEYVSTRLEDEERPGPVEIWLKAREEGGTEDFMAWLQLLETLLSDIWAQVSRVESRQWGVYKASGMRGVSVETRNLLGGSCPLHQVRGARGDMTVEFISYEEKVTGKSIAEGYAQWVTVFKTRVTLNPYMPRTNLAWVKISPVFIEIGYDNMPYIKLNGLQDVSIKVGAGRKNYGR